MAFSTRWALVAAGAAVAAAAVARKRYRRRAAALTADGRAAELRRKLDESRALAAERDEFESGETTVDRAEPASDTVEERRRRVHDQARATVDEMQHEPGTAD